MHTLTVIAAQKSLGTQKAGNVLVSDAYTNTAGENEFMAEETGISGTPLFKLNNTYGLSGAQTPDALEQAWLTYEKLNRHIRNNNRGNV